MLVQSERLRQARDFHGVLQNRVAFSGSFLRLHVKPNHYDFARLGLIVAKRIEHKAVRRNRIKRIVREVFRLNRQKIVGLDCVMQLRNSVDISKDCLCLHQEALMLLTRAERYLKKYAPITD
ncbi:MAG: ribonuclease P protein component [Nitrosomonas sp.]|nr:ribonuclease P protein component [Nitrosomonas sp.]